jgi:hypothetical protein
LKDAAIMSRHFLMTVDTELSNFPRPHGIFGRADGADWGLQRMIEEFDALELRATFFLDVYAGNSDDLAEQQRAAELIVARGHDLQLHTHPGPAFDPRRDQLRHYSLAEQEDIIAFGCRRLEGWTGIRPVLHRAGDWAADHNSLRALARQGFRADFSASPWSRNCSYTAEVVRGNGWTRSDGMLCGVGTCYQDRLTGRVRRVDLGGVSFLEAADILAAGVDPLIMTLHSFSLLRYNKSRTQFTGAPDYIERLRRYCRLARAEWGYQYRTALEAVTEIESATDGNPPWVALPTTRTLSSAAGLLKSVRERLRA